MAFVTSGVLAGMAGAVLSNQIERVSTATFAFTRSIAFVVFAIIGGIGGLPGAVLAGMAFMFGEVAQANIAALRGYLDVFAGTLVIITLLQNPDGLAGIPAKLAHAREERRLKRELRDAEAAETAPIPIDPVAIEPVAIEPVVIDLAEPAAATDAFGAAEANVEVADAVEKNAFDIFRHAARTVEHAPMVGGARTQSEALLSAVDITVRFGGVVANDDVTMEVRSGEIVGLIGPNGAGKTTFFNAVSGFVTPDRGRVQALGHDVTTMPVHARAALGIGRTFQQMRLLPKLTVHENLLVATHMANRSGFFDNLALTRTARDAERQARATVDEVVAALSIDAVQGHRVADLPFGVLRMVELARALVTKPRLLLLDEPASGLESEETELFGQILLDVRDRFSVTMLLIEHDMSLVMAVSDYVYVLEFGRMLAAGTCDQVQADEEVIAAYLGQPATVSDVPAPTGNGQGAHVAVR
jgi:ABC-type branched-subunit amino acid transport system ATPase component